MKNNKTKWALITLAFAAIIGLAFVFSDQDKSEDKPVYMPEYTYEYEKDMNADDWENAIGETETLWSDPKGYIVSMVYDDMVEDQTLRKIKITEIKRNDRGNIYLYAFCFKRNDNRIFRLDRVKSFYDEDGEPFYKSELFYELNIKESEGIQ